MLFVIKDMVTAVYRDGRVVMMPQSSMRPDERAKVVENNLPIFLFKLCLLLSPLVILQTEQIERDSTAASSYLLHHRPDLFNEICHDKQLVDQTKCSRQTQNISNGGPLTGHRWFMGYFDEQADGFELRVFEESLDERLSNIIHMVNSQKFVDNDFFAYNSGDHELDLKVIRAVAGPEVDELKCNEHLKQMVALMSEMSEQLAEKRTNASKRLQFDERHSRLARVLDSFGRYEPGYLSGRTHSTGQFDQCVSSHLLLADAGRAQRVGSRYCWTKLDVNKHLHPSLKHRQRTSHEPVSNHIQIGVCLPKSCHAKTFHTGKLANDNREILQKLVDGQFKLPGMLYIEESLRVDSIFCPVDPDSEQAKLPASGKLALAFLLGWLALAFYATNYYISPKEANKDHFFGSLMDCLNLRKSFKDFLGHKRVAVTDVKIVSNRDKRVDLLAMDAVKVLGCVYVVLGHSIIAQLVVSQNGVKSYHVVMTDPIALLAFLGTSVVDTFFVITGILWAYTRMGRAASTKPAPSVGNDLATATTSAKSASSSSPAPKANQIKLLVFYWLKFTINRHLSLVPMLFVVFWFKKAVLINWFPQWLLWDSGFNRNTAYGACRQESWLSPITLTAAFVPINRQCLPQTWSVATDLFFSLTISPVLFLMPRRPKLALALGSLMTLLSILWTKQAYDSVDPISKNSLENITTEGFASMLSNMHHLYTYPHFRLSSVLIGVLAGYCLFKYNESDKSFEWPKWFKQIATRGSLMTMAQIALPFSFIHYLKPYVHPHHALVMANMFTLVRMAIASCNAVIMMRIVTDWRQSFVTRLFVGRFWSSMIKLNYVILLIHLDVLYFLASGASDYTYFSKHKIMVEFGAAYLFCLPLAVLLHVVYENPISKLVKQHLHPKIERLLG